MAKAPGPIRKAWYEWKMLRFPWRKKWLVGFDLQGNTFWEFKDALHSLRNRRIAKYHRSTHYGDVNVSPGWMQWLRHTRFEPPTIQEQQQEMQRQANMKLLAARADQRWAAKPSALDAPDKQQPIQMLESRDPKSGVVQTNASQELQSLGRESRSAEARTQEGERPAHDMRMDVTPGAEAPEQSTPEQSTPEQSTPEQSTPEQPSSEDPSPFQAKKKLRAPKDPKPPSPWAQSSTGGNPGDDWQPKAWTPPPRRRG